MAKAKTEAECLGHMSYCIGAQGDWDVLSGYSNQTACESCEGNKWTNMHTWRGGRYGAGKMRPREWLERKYVSKNSFGPTLDWNKLTYAIDSAMGALFAATYKSRDLCNLGPVIPVLDKLACACGTTKRDDCFVEKLEMKEAEKPAFENEVTTLVTKDAQIETESEDGDATVDIAKLPFAQYQTAASTATGRQLQTGCANEYKVAGTPGTGMSGQLMGPGIKVSSKGAGKLSYVYLCVSKSLSAKSCDKYPNAKFARALADNTPGHLAPVDVTLKYDGTQFCANFTKEGTYFPVHVDGSSSIHDVPITPAPTASPTMAPTSAPTFVPRVKPVFKAADFDLATFTVVQSIAAVTLAPTSAPTPYPTEAGKQMVEQKKVVKAAVAKMNFPLSEDEAKNPVMQKVLTSGTANALGLDPTDVTITEINGKPVTASRRLASGVDIKMKIQARSDDPAALTALQNDLTTAASEGSVVANIQKEASTAGVLLPALKTMPRKMPAPTILPSVSYEITVQVQIPVTPSPTPAPTSTSSPAPTTATPAPTSTPATPAPPILSSATSVFSSNSMIAICGAFLMLWFSAEH
jgi:hypothetical protein